MTPVTHSTTERQQGPGIRVGDRSWTPLGCLHMGLYVPSRASDGICPGADGRTAGGVRALRCAALGGFAGTRGLPGLTPVTL